MFHDKKPFVSVYLPSYALNPVIEGNPVAFAVGVLVSFTILKFSYLLKLNPPSVTVVDFNAPSRWVAVIIALFPLNVVGLSGSTNLSSATAGFLTDMFGMLT